MKYSFLNKTLAIFASIVFSFSCSSDLDFKQVDEFNIQPVFTTNLAYFDLKASDFVVNGTEKSVLSYLAVIDVFNSSFFDKNLAKTDLFFKVNNTINRAYTLNLALLNNQNQILYNINIPVPAYTSGQNTVTKTVVFDAANVDILINTTKINFTLIMFSGPPLTNTSAGNIELSSSVTAYLDVK
jgi:hypothetical protein